MASFQEHLSRLLTGDLPGETAHLRMHPLNRKASSIAKAEATDFRESAVAVILFEADGDMQCILIQRPTYIGNHSGQVSFPGGKREVEDDSLEVTAMRECLEEIGVDLKNATALGRLTPVFIPVSGFLVEPYLFLLPEPPVFIPDEREVEAVLTISLQELLREENIQAMDITVSTEMVLKDVPYFRLSDKQVWGATAFILSELREILLQLSSEFKI